MIKVLNGRLRGLTRFVVATLRVRSYSGVGEPLIPSAPGSRDNVLLPLRRDVMSDDKSNRGTADRSKISLSDDYEVRYWTNTLGVSKEKLTAAVQAVGNSAQRVKEYVKTH